MVLIIVARASVVEPDQGRTSCPGFDEYSVPAEELNRIGASLVLHCNPIAAHEKFSRRTYS
ncbi:MAG TPA: hypothetical protein VLW75_01640 [Rhizomicrobium sp.]|nr:hypothetical protein [Rhizomicrobium sp.]